MKDFEIIRSALAKHMPGTCADHHIELVRDQIKENEWVFVENHIDNGMIFNICREWADIGLMAKRVIPKWFDGNYKGTVIEFYFRSDLNYSINF